MKKLVLILIAFIAFQGMAQVPNSFSYKSAVFKNDTLPLKNHNIRVDIHVQGSQEKNTEVQYAESHELLTNERGEFFLQIGNGTPDKNYNGLDDVSWVEGNKYVQVSVYNEDNEMVSSGLTQLFSVPYALVAKTIEGGNTSSLIDEVTTISTLRNSPQYQSPATGDIVYVMGHSNIFDNGGGYFVFIDTESITDDNGMIIKPDTLTGNGRWKRINYGVVSARFYGALGGDTNDDTVAIQSAIDFVADKTPKGGLMVIPKGNYYVSQIILKSGVSIKGEYDGTNIFAGANTIGDSLIIMEAGPVVRIEISNIKFFGNNQNIHCFKIEARSLKGSAGGLWDSVFTNLRIQDFGGVSMYFIGGGTNGGNYTYNLPNQFIRVENVRVKKGSLHASRALKMEGQNGQFTFEDCRLDGNNNDHKGWNIELIGVGSINGITTSPSVINFRNVTSQSAIGAIRISACRSVQIDGCWFENLDTAILAENGSIGISVENSRFSNSSNFGESNGSGYIMYTEESSATFTGNVIAGGYAGLIPVAGNAIHFSSENNIRVENGGYIIF